ncbi:two-component system sensor histidine kinase RegB [Stella humosa]|uniref:histidine kinase n=1 Tax=Stella humosa TaxID=94 RepID=A0A3N1LHP9_9PROT|nr:ActS/PrrB/RegB family redox-sensitive histidine kinase [Stella humosa]ROP91057.1 two-component system sensor histidine kinase RegB [Stella humosa]BBK34593.1 two-component sensor histidine kinase [Stella humosa]
MSLSAWIGGDRSRVDGRVWVNLRTLVAIRWLAVIGQAATLVFVQVSLGYPLPLATALLVVGASAAVNIVATLQRPAQTRLTDRDAAAYLAFDVFQLSGLLFLTGGLENPFAVLILAPVTVSATILSRPTTIGLCLFTLLAIVVLVFFRWPLPWPPPGLELPPMYRFGVAAALALATVFIAAYTWQVTAEARRLTEALAATQMALAREQQLSAVGALAAAAAHELGSPLGTIAVVARELSRELPDKGPWREDLDLLESQVARCRDILAELAQRPERNSPFDGIALSLLVDLAAAPHLPAHIDFEIVRDGPDEPAEPIVPERPELRHALGNLLQNAFQFADSEVRATVGWDATEAWILVRDDGPGFRPEVLARIGEPYVSGRDRPGGSMGLGIFIAETLLARTGAGLAVENAASGGAEVAIRWHRDRLEGLQPSPS